MAARPGPERSESPSRRALIPESRTPDSGGIVEVSKKHSPTGQRCPYKPYPTDNGPRTFGVRHAWLEDIAEHIRVDGIGHDDLLFPHPRRHSDLPRHRRHRELATRRQRSAGSTSQSASTTSTTSTRPVAGWRGADLRSGMGRMGHSRIQTTQEYLHTLPDTDQRHLDALPRVQNREPYVTPLDILGSSRASPGRSADASHSENPGIRHQVFASSASSIDFSRARSLVVARLIARSIIGATNREKPDGLPRLRSVILVAPSPAGSHV
jgi:hypothetical protein